MVLKGWPILVAVWLTISTIFAGGCKSVTEVNAVPYIPPSYYQCVEITTYEMAFSYWSPYNGLNMILPGNQLIV